jgi:uncharacterized membrane protein HdeD (DUF308 family)
MNTTIIFSWPQIALNGAIALLYGILALFVPGATIIGILTYIGIFILVVGAIMLIAAIQKIGKKLPYFGDLIWSLLMLIVGGLITFNTQATLNVFVIIVGVWAIILGISQFIIVAKVRLSPYQKNITIVNAIITLIFGFVLFYNPYQSAKFIVVISGIMALVVGILLLVLAFIIKSFSNDISLEE